MTEFYIPNKLSLKDITKLMPFFDIMKPDFWRYVNPMFQNLSEEEKEEVWENITYAFEHCFWNRLMENFPSYNNGLWLLYFPNKSVKICLYENDTVGETLFEIVR